MVTLFFYARSTLWTFWCPLNACEVENFLLQNKHEKDLKSKFFFFVLFLILIFFLFEKANSGPTCLVLKKSCSGAFVLLIQSSFDSFKKSIDLLEFEFEGWSCSGSFMSTTFLYVGRFTRDDRGFRCHEIKHNKLYLMFLQKKKTIPYVGECTRDFKIWGKEKLIRKGYLFRNIWVNACIYMKKKKRYLIHILLLLFES